MKIKKQKESIINILCFIFYTLFTLSFSYVFINCFFREISVYKSFQTWIYLILGILTLLLWILLYQAIKKIFSKATKKTIIIIFGITFLLSIALLVILYLILDIPFGWDFGIVYEQAKSYALTHDRLKLAVYPEYFQLFPNNIPIFFVETVLFRLGKLLGIKNFASIGVVFNGLLIFLAILFMVLYVYRKWGKEKAYFSLVLSFFFLPLYLYLPVFYSDTMSVMFGPLILFISTFFEDDNKKKNILLLILISIVLFIGMKAKMTIFFFFFSLFAAFFSKKQYRRCVFFIAIFLICYLGCNQVFKIAIAENKSFNFTVNDYGKIPTTHWAMMGLEDPKADNSGRNTYGGYNEADYKITQSYHTGKESIPRHIKEIKKRLKSYGVIGYADYLTKKAVNAWGDGSYFVQVALTIGNSNQGKTQGFLAGRNNDIIFYIEEGVQIAFLMMLCLSGIYCMKKKENETLGEHIAIFLLFAFLLVWENRSRYLYNYIPIFIIIITFYIDKLTLLRRKTK